MSAELKDFRGKITAETDAVLEALNRASGRDRCEIAREVLHKWAVEQLEAAKLMVRLARCEGTRRGVRWRREGISGSQRQVTVADLIDELKRMPQHQPVKVLISEVYGGNDDTGQFNGEMVIPLNIEDAIEAYSVRWEGNFVLIKGE